MAAQEDDTMAAQDDTMAAQDSGEEVSKESSMGRVLSEELEAEISKGVDIVDCMAGFGKHWTGDITGGLGTSGADHKDPAQTVTSIDDFISHDWATWGKLKYITLCYAYNGIAAGIVAIIVAGLFGTLEIFLPEMRLMTKYRQIVAGEPQVINRSGYFGLLMGNIAFSIMLFFWQPIKRTLLCGKKYMVFMDKMCIHQTDPELKAKGILGLAGFLRISDRLVILWSPRYFSRLWCVYEIASWVSQGKSLRRIEINPVAEGSFMFCIHFGVTTLSVLLVVLARFEDTWYYVAMATATGFAAVLPLHIMRRNVRDLNKMPSQIKSFSFDNAECFCCGVNHVIPGTDIKIPCDREVISEKLKQWFKKGNGSPIELFNHYVRAELGKHILRRVGGSKVRYTSACICCISGWLFISDRLVLLWELDGWAAWRCFMHYCTLVFAIFPSILRFALETAVLFDKIVGIRTNPCQDVLVTILACMPTTLPTLGLMAALQYTLQLKMWWPQVVVTAGCVLVCLILYREDPIAWYHYLCRSKDLVPVSGDASKSAEVEVEKPTTDGVTIGSPLEERERMDV